MLKELLDQNNIQIGDRVSVFLEDWYSGTVLKIDPYSDHRKFYWVELDALGQAILKISRISVFNPKHIKKLEKK